MLLDIWLAQISDSPPSVSIHPAKDFKESTDRTKLHRLDGWHNQCYARWNFTKQRIHNRLDANAQRLFARPTTTRSAWCTTRDYQHIHKVGLVPFNYRHESLSLCRRIGSLAGNCSTRPQSQRTHAVIVKRFTSQVGTQLPRSRGKVSNYKVRSHPGQSLSNVERDNYSRKISHWGHKNHKTTSSVPPPQGYPDLWS